MADRSHIYDELREMVDTEIDAITKKGSLDEKTLMCLDKLIDIRKDLAEIGTQPFDTMRSQSGRYDYNMAGNGMSGRMYDRARYGRNDMYGYARDGSDMMNRMESMYGDRPY